MKIWVHCIVHNEDQFLWYAIKSVIDHIDKVLLWDTGSTDKTSEIAELLKNEYPDKIEFQEKGDVSVDQFTQLRQEMLEQSKCDWILLVDGDEIWPEHSIKDLTSLIKEKGKNLDAVIVPFYVLLGDIYHYQDEEAGEYRLLGKKGHLSMRAMNSHIPGLHLDLPYGQEGFYDQSNQLIDQRKKVLFSDTPYFHATHLVRSSHTQKLNKIKYELGNKFSSSIVLPEVFHLPRPAIIPDALKLRDSVFMIKAGVLTPLRKIKRKIKRRDR